MSADRQRLISDLCHAALERNAADRAAFLREACAGDEALRQEVESLLRYEDAGGQFLERPAVEEVARLVSSQPESNADLTGRRLGVYQIEARIGEGGMGEVYRARDTKLGRDVAIKVLPLEFTRSADRRARFEREARLLASLNHPHIAQVYGFEESEGIAALVMELVPGETLDAIIQARGLTLAHALAVARQICDALEAAHEKGIVHRDLKPANIKVTPEGVVKVLDFGLAKASAGEFGMSEATNQGVLLGTATYMSPEQARGQPVDKRTDIWAFGCVLYEMLTGRRAFAGDSLTDTLAHVIEREPDWRAVPETTPEVVRRLLERCLQKDVRRRLRDIGDARLELEEPITGTSSIARTTLTSRRRLAWWLAASGMVIAGAILGWRLRPDASPRDPFAGATFKRLTDWDGAEEQVAISRDGKFVAFVSDRSAVWDAWVGQVGADSFSNLTNGRTPDLRNLGAPNVGFTPDGSLVTLWTRLTDPASGVQAGGWTVPTIGGQLRPYLDQPEPNVAEVAWSRDGRRLAYHTGSPGDPMFVRELDAAPERQIYVSNPGIHNHFLLWSPDARFVYFVRGFPPDQMDLWRIRADGAATPDRLTFHESRVAFPTFLDDRTLLYLATGDDGSGPWVYVLDVDRRVSRRLNTGVDPYTSIATSVDGRRIVGAVSRSTSGLWRGTIDERPIDESRAVRIALPTAHGLSPRFGPDYTLYRASTSGTDGVWKLGEGQKPTELWNAGDGRVVAAPAIAPNGRQFAFPVRRGGVTRLHVMKADGRGVREISQELDVRGSPAWSPDGQWIAVAANRGGQPALFKLPINGGPPVLLVQGFALDPVWSPSGRFLIYSGADVGTTFALKAVAPDGSPYPLPELVLGRGARHVAFLGGDDALVLLKGDMSYKELWVRDLKTGRERQLTALGRGFTIGDFDISPDGRELLFDRSRDESDIVLIERPK